MPKREKTPPPPDDEPRYLTVVHPYPLNANLMLHADRRRLALWLACCTGKDVLLAMYHKPTVSGILPMSCEFWGDRAKAAWHRQSKMTVALYGVVVRLKGAELLIADT